MNNDIEEQKAFGKRLAALRKKHGYTQTELAELVGITRKMIADYERGKARIHATTLINLTQILNTTAEKMFGLEPMPDIEEAVDLRYMKRLRYMKQMPKENQQTLFMLIDNYLRKSGVDIPKFERSSGKRED